MPYLKLTTNKTVSSDETPSLMSRLSKLMAEQTGKPERYVLVEVEGDKSMLFAGTSEPLAYLECKSIGLSPKQAKSISNEVSRLLTDLLAINGDRVYIEFSNCPAEFWGWNGSTFG